MPLTNRKNRIKAKIKNIVKGAAVISPKAGYTSFSAAYQLNDAEGFEQRQRYYESWNNGGY